MSEFIAIEDIMPGNSYACKFRIETMLDTHDNPPTHNDHAFIGPGVYQGLGIYYTT